MLSAAALLLGCGRSTAKKITQLRSDLASGLPVGSTDTQVKAYLDRNRIEHSEYKEAGGKDELRFFGAPGRIDAIIRSVETSLISRVDIRIVFLFDQKRTLRSYEVSQVVTSL
jgi:hypothetical protein